MLIFDTKFLRLLTPLLANILIAKIQLYCNRLSGCTLFGGSIKQ